MTESMRLLLLVMTAVAMLVAMLLSVLLERSGHIRLRHWSENASENLRGLYSRRRRFEAFRFLLALLARLLPVVFLGIAWWQRPSWATGAWAPALALLAFVAALEVWSRALVRRHSERALQLLSPAYRASFMLLWPLVVVLAPLIRGENVTTRPGHDEEEDDEASDGEIAAFIDVGRREGILEPEEEALVRSVVDFGDTFVRSIMTPRVEINSAPVDADLEALAAKFFASKNSRLPIFRDSIDHVEGVLHIRDLFQVMHEERADVDLLELCQKPHYVPENKPLPDLLTELQKLHQQMAIVVDEYGGVAGLVTVEDLVEEIVGDIRDEHEEEAEAEELGDGAWRLTGRTHLEDFEEMSGLDFDADDLPYETLSGLICGELGYVPKEGETLEWQGLEMLVEEADERRVTRVTVRLPSPLEAEGGAAAAS